MVYGMAWRTWYGIYYGLAGMQCIWYDLAGMVHVYGMAWCILHDIWNGLVGIVCYMV